MIIVLIVILCASIVHCVLEAMSSGEGRTFVIGLPISKAELGSLTSVSLNGVINEGRKLTI